MTVRQMALLAGGLLLAQPAAAKKCPADSVQVGPICVDKYEASVWEIPPANTSLIKKVQKSKIATAADLAGATQRGAAGNDYGAACPPTAAGCKNDYAVSIPGVTPSGFIDWFQADAACRNAGKRLLTNAEWQRSAYGTPDPGTDNGTSDCNVGNTFAVSNTGSRSLCVSDVGAFDMVGNLDELVADWVPQSTACPGWDGFSNDLMCLSGASTTATAPGALLRGGDCCFGVGGGTDAGVFAVVGDLAPSFSDHYIGFRCGR